MKRATYKSELARVKKMAKRLEEQGYDLGKSIESLTLRQLKKIKSGKELVDKGYYKFGERAYEQLRRKQILKNLSKVTKRAEAAGYEITTDLNSLSATDLRNIRGISDLRRKGLASKRYSRPVSDYERDSGSVINLGDVTRAKYDSSGDNIPRNNVFRGSEATVQIDMLLSIAEYGRYYRSIKADTSGQEAVNESGKRLIKIITDARLKHTDEELVEAIEKSPYGSVRALARFVERMVLAVYDEEYASWADGGSAYNMELDDIRRALMLM